MFTVLPFIYSKLTKDCIQFGEYGNQSVNERKCQSLNPYENISWPIPTTDLIELKKSKLKMLFTPLKYSENDLSELK